MLQRSSVEPLWNNLKHEHGPFDIIGDVHGCFDELVDLLKQLGYSIENASQRRWIARGYSVKRRQKGEKLFFWATLWIVAQRFQRCSA